MNSRTVMNKTRFDVRHSTTLSTMMLSIAHSNCYLKGPTGERKEAYLDVDASTTRQVSTRIDANHVTMDINMLLEGQISLLHKACENNNFEMMYFLICHRTESLVHPVTGHTVLHSACLEGSRLCTQVVLQNYPELIDAPTVEGVLPLHAACECGHAHIVELILSFPYPDVMHKVFREQTGARLYRLGFDINAKDGDGRTALHLAATNGHIEIVHLLLSFAVCSMPKTGGDDCEAVEQFHPIEVDGLDFDRNSALHMAVKRSDRTQSTYRQIALLLLQHGANANKPLIGVRGNSSAFLQACNSDDIEMMDLLLGNGATDHDHTVLRSAIEKQNDKMVATVLKYRSHVDAEYQVNQNAVATRRRSSVMARRRSSVKKMWPNVAVVLNWHGLGLPLVSHAWLNDVCLLHNSPMTDIRNHQLVLAAITRIDVSRNNLSMLPEELFQLPSLRLLSAAENYIRWIPGCQVRIGMDAGNKQVMGDDSGIFKCNIDCAKVSSVSVATRTWNSPLLKEVDLQHNQLKDLPADLFELPSLRKLNVSHNILDVVPYDMWTSETLVELNLCDNKLKSLPCFRTIHTDHPVSSTETFNYSTSPQISDRLSDNERRTLFDYGDLSSDEYEDLPVQFVSQWQQRLSVSMATVYDDIGDGNTRMSRLSELNLSRNALTRVPEGLSCLAPQLSKLNLSHNKITSAGAIQNFPISVKWIDLSFNAIERCVLPGAGVEVGRSMDSGSASRLCYSAFCQARPTRSYMTSPSCSRVHRCHSRTSSSGSLKSATPTSPSGCSSGTYAMLVSCVHQQHRQLLSLRTLRLVHNGLTHLQLTADKEEGEDIRSSSDTTSQQSWQSQDLSRRSDPTVFCPNLSALDLSENALGSLTPQVGQLMHLAELRVTNNKQLKELPTSLGMLKKLWNLSFCGCPVERNLQALLGQKAKKTSAVLGYLKSVKEEAVPYNRMKLMLVGIQSIGKTSLLRLLRKEGKAKPERSKNWAQRMGQEGMKSQDVRGENISTVGVDIGSLVLQRGSQEIIFRTWDFGGQREYYATHQYFLSKRSVYLVLWKVTDGEKGVNEILQWLVSVQAHAPNSPVIIVGTHLDLITRKKYPVNYLLDLQQLIYDKYMDHTDPEKSGLPRVIGRIEVSCRSRLMFNSHIDELVDIIWSIVLEEPQPGNRNGRLLEQKVPASYVHLEDVVAVLAEERIQQGKDPVLRTEQYKQLVMKKMEELYGTSFRDITELSLATNFLHENGVLLHYDDTSLQDIYFLDPQWLCDVLASVVTIREINSLAKSGIMRTEDLKILFKNTTFKAEDIKTYIIDLLNKFEVALLWNNQNLLIPSLLPTEGHMRRDQPGCDVRIPVRGVMPSVGQEGVSSSSTPSQTVARSVCKKLGQTATIPTSVTETAHQVAPAGSESGNKRAMVSMIEHTNNAAVSLVRLYLMSYFPSGFWPRLITRLLGDEAFYWLAHDFYDLPELVASNESCRKMLDASPEWKCWQTGVELTYMGVTIMRLKETLEENPRTFCDYRHCHLVLKQDTDIDWVPVNMSALSVLEILIPNQSLVVHFDVHENTRHYDTSPMAASTMVVQPTLQAIASLMAWAVDHIDTLLEDWYPDVGVRFMQNSKGMYLITRVVPCIRCLVDERERQTQQLEESSAWCVVDVSLEDHGPKITEPIINGGVTDANHSRQMTGSVYNMAANATSLLPHHDRWRKGVAGTASTTPPPPIYCHMTEQCFQAAQLNKIVSCPLHGNLGPYFIGSAKGCVQLAHIAPDSMFQDIGDQYLVSDEHITRGKFLGKGAFGAVYAGSMIEKRTGNTLSVAMKMLQPVPPGKDATGSQRALYQKEYDRWKKEPLKNCCQSYLNVRKELSILLTLRHDNIVPLLGICLHPLCLILSLAPHGALSEKLQDYRRAGARLSPLTVHAVVAQVASALAYLHSHQIIYRDLKAENILVWSLPPPHYVAHTPYSVKVCLADYGISRTVLPSGVKGLAGTPPFIAPEIIQYNGEEPYTEKVDCFSFGMFMYEMMMLKLPFDGEGSALGGANLKGHIMAGGRPTITHRDLSLPTPFLDLMTLCWSQDPSDRPSASEIVSLASAPEFSHLQNVISLDGQLEVSCAGAAPIWQLLVKPGSPFALEDASPCTDVWIALRTSNESAMSQGRIHVYTYHQMECVQAKSLPLEIPVVTCMCVTDDWMWCGDIDAVIHVFSLQDYTEMLTFPATSCANVHIKGISYGRPEAQLYIVLDNGHFIICTANIPMFGVEPNYSPVKTECPGNGKPIHCVSVLMRTPSCCELWCGQTRGCISVWNLHSTRGSLQRLQHPLPQAKSVPSDVVFVVTCPQDSSSVWSYIYPGSVIYRWNTNSMKLDGQTDLSQLVPPPSSQPSTYCTQSAQPHSNSSQVTALLVSGDDLYVGTTGGRVFILDKVAMTTVTMLHCHGDNTPYIRAILPLPRPHQMEEDQDLLPGQDTDVFTNSGVVTIGKGYREMFGRFLGRHQLKVDKSLTYILCWMHEHWRLCQDSD